jgi:tetratricopeptide (TPR) repeat protein
MILVRMMHLYYRLGLIQSLDTPDQAAITLSQAVALDTSYAEPLTNMRATLDHWDPRVPDLSYANIGTSLLTLNEFALAEEAFARAVAHNAVYADALAYLAYARSRQDRPALSIAQQAAALAPNSPRVHYLVGLTWKHYNRPVEARQAFERAYELDPQNPALCVEIASTHRIEGNREWAEQWMLESVRLAPDDPRFRLLLVQFYVDEEYKVSEAGLPLAQQLVRDYPDSAEAHDALAWAYFRL